MQGEAELRSLFETGAPRLAMQKDRTALIGPLMAPVAAAALALEASDFAKCEELDTAFHEALIAASGNRYLTDSYRAISSRVRALRSRLPRQPERVASAIAQHRKIIDFVAIGREDAAEAEIAAHARNVQHLLDDIRTEV
jgi:DNA-binding GntR family transcriptional regulator